MAYEQIQSTQTDAKSPIDEQLLDVGLRLNSDDHEARINVLEAASGGGGDTSAEGRYADILENRLDIFNDLKHWRKRYDVHTSLIGNGGHDVLSDYEGKSTDNRIFWRKDKLATGWLGHVSVNYTHGHVLTLPKDAEICFKIKEGENYFGITNTNSTALCDAVEVLIDDQTITANSLTDENGVARANTYATVSAITQYGKTEWFYGLDGKPHTITLKNSDSGSDPLNLESVVVGYLSNDYSMNHDIKLDRFSAVIKGASVTISEQSKSFTPSTGYGHTGMLKADQAGVVTAVDGLEPAMTQVKPEEEIEFSGPIISIPVKSSRDFPDNGICLMSIPTGEHYFFSYGFKTESAVQSHKLQQILFHTKPVQDITPLNDFSSTSKSSTWGDININHWAEAPIKIDATNNKLDFTVTINGTKTTHVATLSQGYYAADLVKLGTHIEKIMQSVKPLTGKGSYYVEWNTSTKTWRVGTRGNFEIEGFELLIATGANASTSVGVTLGFSVSDFTGSLSYTASIKKYHEAVKVQYSTKWISQGSPQKKQCSTSLHGQSSAPINVYEIGEKTGEWIDTQDTNTYPFSIFYPDADATGLEIFVGGDADASTLEVQIDNGAPMYLIHQDSSETDADLDYLGSARVYSCFVSFPRGSKAITCKSISASLFNTYNASSSNLILIGAKQYSTKPRWEELGESEAILETFDIAPLSQWGVNYGHTTSLYVPQASNDNINSITEVGSWSAWANTTGWNGPNGRQTSTTGDYVEYNITLQGKGSFRWKLYSNTLSLYDLRVYISSGTINETTDLISKAFIDRVATVEYDWDAIEVQLPAGTWTIRIKNGGGGSANLYNLGFTVIDTVQPQGNIVNVNEDNTNTGMGIPFPVHTRKHAFTWDNRFNVPYLWRRGTYREGEDSFIDTGGVTQTLIDADARVNNTMWYYKDTYFNGYRTFTNVNEFSRFIAPCRAIVAYNHHWTTYSPVVNPTIDGRSVTATSAAKAVKGGSGPSTTRTSDNPAVSKSYEMSGTMVGTLFTLSDTRGIKVGQKVLIVDNTGADEEAIVAVVTTDVSITITSSLSVLLPANVVAVKFYGLHSIRLTMGDSGDTRMSHYDYEPLPLLRGRCRAYNANTNQKLETVTAFYKTVYNGAFLAYPVHSDGVLGDFNTSTINILRNGGADTYWYITPSLYVYAAGSLDFQIQSTRMVNIDITDQELYNGAK